MSSNTTWWTALLAGALGMGWVGCGTSELPLPYDGPLTPPEGPEEGAPEEVAGAAVAAITVTTEPISTRLRVQSSYGSSGDSFVSSGYGSSAWGLAPGEHELILELGGVEVQREELTVAAGKVSQLVIFVGGTAANPTLRVDEVDLSAPGAGLRRARASNFVPDGEPVQLFYYDASDQLVAQSEPIAAGQTWSGTIPGGAVGFRLSPTQAQTQLFRQEFIDSLYNPEFGTPCVETPGVGVVIFGRYQTRVIAGNEVQAALEAYEPTRAAPPACAAD